MERIDMIFRHPEYQSSLKKLKEEEKERIFCRHNMQHFLDVARIAYIFNLERGYGLSKEMIYAAALLHDIGKWQQYRKGTPHEIASAEIAELILMESGFVREEREEILHAIRMHRKGEGEDALSIVIYDADKKSRSCYACEAHKECNWSKEKKNRRITV